MVILSDLKRQYIGNPTAYWTTYSRLKRLAHRYEVDEKGVYHGDGVFSFAMGQIALDDFAQADAFYLPIGSNLIPKDPWVTLGYGCRLKFASLPNESVLPTGFQFATVQLDAEKQSVIDVVNSCYGERRFGERDFDQLTMSDTYDPNLWIWVVESLSDVPIAVFISEYDREIGEVNLDWCQVFPEHRSRGIGRALVGETIQRAEGAAIITVGTQDLPEGRFYERCGFSGQKYMFFKHKERELLPYDRACRAAG